MFIFMSIKHVIFLVNLFLVNSVFASSGSGSIFDGLDNVANLFKGRFAAIIGTIALVVGVVSYLVSTSTDLSPILRLLIKIVFCLSLMVGGSTMLASIVSGISGSII